MIISSRRTITAPRKALLTAIWAVVTSIIFAACGSSSPASAAKSSSSPATTSASAAAAAYFKGKTITIIAPDSPGGDFDLYARIIAPALGKYLGATVNVENVPGAATVVGTNQMAAAAPNGLILGMIDTSADIGSLIQKKPGQNFDLTKLSWIGQMGTSPDVFLTSPKSGVTTFSQLLHTTTPINVLDTSGSLGDLFNKAVLGAFHIPYKLITGYGTSSALKQGLLANDGQFLFENLPPFLSMLRGGQAKALLVTSEPTLSTLSQAVGNATTLSQALKSVTLTSAETAALNEVQALSNLDFDLAGPPGIPAARLAVLRSAFQKALSDPSTVAKANTESEPLGYVSGPQVASNVISAISKGSAILVYVK